MKWGLASSPGSDVLREIAWYVDVRGFDPAVQQHSLMGCGVSSDLDGYRGALKREVFFHTFFCVLVRICNQTSSNQHLLVVGC